MPIKYRYDVDSNVVYEMGWGEVTFRDLEEYHKELLGLPLKPGFKDLADYTKAKVMLTSDELWRIKNISNAIAELIGSADFKLAIVVNDNLSYGMARMFTMTSDVEQLEIMVFKTISEACAWLGIEEPSVENI